MAAPGTAFAWCAQGHEIVTGMAVRGPVAHIVVSEAIMILDALGQ